MADSNKKSLSYKLQKNPLLLVFGIIAIAVALFVIVNVTSAIKEKMDAKAETETTQVDFVSTTVPETEKAEDIKNIKIYNKDITSYSVDKTEVSFSLAVEYNSKESLLKTHNATDANNVDYVPVFCFYNEAGTMFKCPGDLKLNPQNNTAVYTLGDINDFANAIALTDEITVTNDNIFDLPFNICLQSKSSCVLGETLMGTHSRDAEGIGDKFDVALINPAQGIKKAELVKTDEFVWLDIYFDDYTAYTELNNDFINNFVCFRVNYNGAVHNNDFLVTEYDSLNMVRCKFDAYSMEEFSKVLGNSDLTVADIFSGYPITIYTSDYDVETVLFSLTDTVVTVPDTSEEA